MHLDSNSKVRLLKRSLALGKAFGGDQAGHRHQGWRCKQAQEAGTRKYT